MRQLSQEVKMMEWLNAAGHVFGTTPDQILGNSKCAHIVAARRCVMHLMRQSGMTFNAIDRAFDSTCNTSCHNDGVVHWLLRNNQEFRRKLELVKILAE